MNLRSYRQHIGPRHGVRRPPQRRQQQLRRSRVRRLTAFLLIFCGGVILLGQIWAYRQFQQKVAAINQRWPHVVSPNWNVRPFFTRPNCVVIHATATRDYATVERAFSRSDTGVSAHFVVDKAGKITQFVPVERAAWHAGRSQLLDEPGGVNRCSIGIELVNRNDGQDKFTDAQYQATAEILRALRTVYTIPDARVVSHAEIALPPGRKSDPRGFDFVRLKQLADAS